MSSRGRWILIDLLLAPAVILPLWVPLYDRKDPKLGGFPFFYWFQFALILVAVVLTILAYLLAQGADRTDRARHGLPPEPTTAEGRPRDDDHVDGVAFGVFVFLFLLVTVLGFAAARWRRAEDLDSLDEWGLGGRGFGTFIAWFLIGGDIYTAYTFIAVPATLYAGSVVGFFAVPYTIVVYPLIFLFLPRLWSVSHRHGYVTPADFVQGRYDSRPLATAVAVTGILATMPYIALQLVGMQVVLEVMGIGDRQRQLVRQGPAAVHRVRGAGGLHLLQRPARAGADRVRQGHADLHRDHRGGPLHPAASSAAGATSSTPSTPASTPSTPRTPTRSRPGPPRARASCRPTGAVGLRLARARAPRWRCSCIPTRSPASSPPGAAR